MVSIYSANDSAVSSSEADGSNGLVQDRFQGALIGLWMVPIALRSSKPASTSEADVNKGKGDLWPERTSNREALSAAIAYSLAQVDTFLHSPQNFSFQYLRSSEIDSVCAPDSLAFSSLALSSLPVLLRYHSDYLRRDRAVLTLMSKSELEQNAQHLAQCLVLGDVLSMAFNAPLLNSLPFLGDSMMSLPTVAALERQASSCGLSSLQRRRYQDLWQSLSSRMLRGSTEASDPVIEGIAIALTQPSYPTALLRAQQTARNYCDSRKYTSRSVPTDSFFIESMLVASVVAGVWWGRRSLPVLWQMQSCNKPIYVKCSYSGRSWRLQQAIGMANSLFDQWAGITQKTTHYNG